ncbi:MAG: thioredoxin family protein [Spirochaetota bacterium]
MKSIFIILAAAMLLAAVEEPVWNTSIPDAITNANGKIVFVLFSGSDWCSDCIKLKKNVIDTEAFSAYAKENLILVSIDFPKNKKLPDDLRRANAEAKSNYNVRGYPTAIVLSPDGSIAGRITGSKGTPDEYVQKIIALKK